MTKRALITGITGQDGSYLYFRPTETSNLQADILKARKQLNWNPRVDFKELVKIMMEADLQLAERNL